MPEKSGRIVYRDFACAVEKSRNSELLASSRALSYVLSTTDILE